MLYVIPEEQCTVDLTFFYLVAMEIVSVIVAWQPSETSQTPTAISARFLEIMLIHG